MFGPKVTSLTPWGGKSYRGISTDVHVTKPTFVQDPWYSTLIGGNNETTFRKRDQ